MFRPDFHFEIISGDSVSLDTESSSDKAVVTAEKAGTSVVKVTYHAADYKGQYWDAISDVNTGYAVYTVGETGTTTITTNDEFANWRHYDTIYYNEGATTPYTFTVDTENAESVKVTVNGLEIQGEDNQYTADLENRSNIIGIEATDSEGNVKSMYRVIDARYIDVNVENKTRPDQTLRAGDTATVSFKGITMPVYKLATIYNPCYNSFWGDKPTRVTYENDELGSFEGVCSQWDLATNNDFDVIFTKAGTYTFSSANGIDCYWWGDTLGADMSKQGQGNPNTSADTHRDYFSVLPEFTIQVEDKILAESITLDKETLEMETGTIQQLKATVLPQDAQSVIEWSSSDEKLAIVDETGLVTALSAGEVEITAKADGVKAVCKITISGETVPVPVESISLSPKSIDSEVGYSATLQAKIKPETVSADNIVWSSDDESVATVDSNGKVVLVGVGKTTVRAKIGDVEGTCPINAVPGWEASEVISVIEKLPALDDVTLEDAEKVQAARDAYDKLDDEIKAQVTNLEALEAAEAKIKELKAEAADKEAAAPVIEMIGKLGSITKLSQKASVQAARAAYNKLSASQKKLVTNLDVLEAAEAKIAALQKAEKRDSFNAAKISLSKTKYVYDGKAKKPAVKGLSGLTNGTDYTISYSGNIKTGKATVTVKGKGDCAGLSKTAQFRIVPKKAAISKVKKGKKSMQVRIKSQKKSGVTGYQIAYKYGKNGKFKKVTTTKTVKKIKKLKNKKYYYVKVRAYKKIDGKKYYGAYSKVKKVKVR